MAGDTGFEPMIRGSKPRALDLTRRIPNYSFCFNSPSRKVTPLRAGVAHVSSF
ncbi:hypothetical protein VPHD260_0085 [Vibrio phage D260]